jgi:hypothetical protein
VNIAAATAPLVAGDGLVNSSVLRAGITSSLRNRVWNVR